MLSVLLSMAMSADALDRPDLEARNALFAVPVRLEAAGKLIQVEAPGYAAPCWADIDEDGKKDLIVGQFNGGKMMVYRNLGNGELAKGEWLMAGGKAAEVPGVW